MNVAEQSIAEGNKELSEVISKSATLSKTKLVDEMMKAQSKIEMGMKWKEQLLKGMEIVLIKKKKMEEKWTITDIDVYMNIWIYPYMSSFCPDFSNFVLICPFFYGKNVLFVLFYCWKLSFFPLRTTPN